MERVLQPGTVVTTKVASRVRKGSKGVVISDDGNLTQLMLDSGVGTFTRDQVAQSRDQTPPAPPMRFRLPYGVWTREDGGQVLFNRNYRPLFMRPGAGQTAQQANGNEWVRFRDQEWFYGDGDGPWESVRSLKRCEAVLTEWGFAGWLGENLPPAAWLRSNEEIDR